MKFRQIGAKSEVELKQNHVVYTSDSLITSMSYSGGMHLVYDSTTFTKEMKEKIKNIMGMVSLGSTNGVLKNIHVYSANAKALDGRERICYLQQDGDDLIVTDYKGNRGAKYSALFNRLQEQMVIHGLVSEGKNRFRVSLKEVDTFVKTVNIVIEERRQEKYELLVLNEIESIVIHGYRYFYNKADWVRKEDTDNQESVKDIMEKAIADLIDKVKFMDDVATLMKFNVELCRLSEAVVKKISYLECLDNV